MRTILTTAIILTVCGCDIGDGYAPKHDTDAADTAYEITREVTDTIKVEPESELASECLCHTISACCDGCDLIDGPCDDGLDCTVGEACAEGRCIGGHSPCDRLRTVPECQVTWCDEQYGCSGVFSGREGFPCGEGGTCTDGECHVAPCVCSEGPCCDGCHFRDSYIQCDDTAYWRTCRGEGDADPIVFQYLGVQYCSGISAGCDGELSGELLSTMHCPQGEVCYQIDRYDFGCL